MKKCLVSSFVTALQAIGGIALAGPVAPPPPDFDTAKIEQIVGVTGAYTAAEGVFKVQKARTEVSVTVDGRKMAPFQGLTGWASFKDASMGGLMVMGDTVLFQDEVNPAMSAALASGLEVTALHNHFFFDDPKVYFMHISGMGKLEDLAQAVHNVWSTIDQIRAAKPQPASVFDGTPLPATDSITAVPLQAIFGQQGTAKDGLFKATFGRSATMASGNVIGNQMGVNTWAAFAGSDDLAVVDGDFAVHEDELQTVLKSLRGSGINIVAIHSHMTGETPRTLFLHYWGKGKAVDLAQAVKSALALTPDLVH